MSKEIIQLSDGAIKEELKELVRGSVEETLNNLLEKEAQEFTRRRPGMNERKAVNVIAAGIVIEA